MNTTTPAAHGPTFGNLGIAPNILTVLTNIAYTSPTPIQQQAIGPAIEGKDIVGIAQTGTGKTLAFGVPVIQKMLGGEGTTLILVPTRELAIQVEETFTKVGRPLGISTVVLIGGAPIRPQVAALRRRPRVIIATPGRLMDHMEQKTVSLANINFLVLDEADRMLDMGFLPSIKKILAAIPTERQTLLFSATLSEEIMSIATKAMKLPLQIEIAPQGTTAANITQEIFVVRRDDKLRLLEKVLSDYKGSTIIFARTKHGATKVAFKVMHMGHTAAEIHSNRSLGQRKAALEGFKNGKYRVLVATDIVARGIDVKGVELVINFDLPDQSSDYVHRIGRTARAGAAGHAISFATPDERRDIKDIEKLIKKPIKLSPVPADLPGVSAPLSSEGDRPRSVHRSSGGRPSFGARSGGSSSFGSRPRTAAGSSSFGSRPRSSAPFTRERSEFSKPGHYAPRPSSSPRSSRPTSFSSRPAGDRPAGARSSTSSGYEGSNPRPARPARSGGFGKSFSYSDKGSDRSSGKPSRGPSKSFSKGFSKGPRKSFDK
ncbi:MAG: DEAD/DEAH box helicase [Candidatus Pacebacteria bacterium]|nr:DEAD/DEAH box helicase [Candidatus Paceibacterota bacterium]